MPQTVQSALTSYLTAGEFLKRVDVGTIGDLCSDNKVRIPLAALLVDPVTGQVNANLQAGLDDASGAFESAVMCGGKYTLADLGNLVGTPSVGRARVYRIITAIAKVYLMERRPGTKVPDEFTAGVDREQAALRALAQGTEILSFADAQAAGQPSIVPVTPLDVVTRFGPVVQADRYFGTRSDRAIGPHGW